MSRSYKFNEKYGGTTADEVLERWLNLQDEPKRVIEIIKFLNKTLIGKKYTKQGVLNILKRSKKIIRLEKTKKSPHPCYTTINKSSFDAKLMGYFSRDQLDRYVMSDMTRGDLNRDFNKFKNKISKDSEMENIFSHIHMIGFEIFSLMLESYRLVYDKDEKEKITSKEFENRREAFLKNALNFQKSLMPFWFDLMVKHFRDDPEDENFIGIDYDDMKDPDKVRKEEVMSEEEFDHVESLPFPKSKTKISKYNALYEKFNEMYPKSKQVLDYLEEDRKRVIPKLRKMFLDEPENQKTLVE